MQQHPLSAAFPSMCAEDLSALTDDIARNGQRQPITVFEGMVLDGWHRFTACRAAGIEPATVEFDPDDDPVAFVLSMNLSRRHLSGSQRAAAVVACSEWAPSHRPNKAEAASAFSTSKEMAERAEVSERVIRQAKAAQRAGLGDAVRDGKMSAEKAAKLARGEAPKAKPRRQLVVEEVPELEPELDEQASERLGDIVREYEALCRIVEGDDKLAAAWDEAKALAAKLADLERLYDAKCRELAEMTKEAKRWMRKAQTAEKAGAK